MKTYIFTNKDTMLKDCYQAESIQVVLEKIAENTDTTDLVVAIYLLKGARVWRGELFEEWLKPTDFYHNAKRRMAFIKCFEIPKGLPKRFKLIRVAFGLARRFGKGRVNMYLYNMSRIGSTPGLFWVKYPSKNHTN